MIEGLSWYVSFVFILTTLIAVFLLFLASNKSIASLVLILVWLAVQSVISLNGFYTITNTIPPHFALLGGPAIIFILVLFLTKKGRVYIDNLDVKMLTYLQTIRIPVELVLLWLYTAGYVPKLMTFEGRNFDILSGITAPIVAFYAFRKPQPNKKLLLVWNIICLGLLMNIVVNAILSAPFSFQQFAFDHPNIAILYFPFTWLPCCVVPIVLFSHLASIRQLTKR